MRDRADPGATTADRGATIAAGRARVAEAQEGPEVRGLEDRGVLQACGGQGGLRGCAGQADRVAHPACAGRGVKDHRATINGADLGNLAAAATGLAAGIAMNAGADASTVLTIALPLSRRHAAGWPSCCRNQRGSRT